VRRTKRQTDWKLAGRSERTHTHIEAQDREPSSHRNGARCGGGQQQQGQPRLARVKASTPARATSALPSSSGRQFKASTTFIFGSCSTQTVSPLSFRPEHGAAHVNVRHAHARSVRACASPSRSADHGLWPGLEPEVAKPSVHAPSGHLRVQHPKTSAWVHRLAPHARASELLEAAVPWRQKSTSRDNSNVCDALFLSLCHVGCKPVQSS
jgi:hypothetical protein